MKIAKHIRRGFKTFPGGGRKMEPILYSFGESSTEIIFFAEQIAGFESMYQAYAKHYVNSGHYAKDQQPTKNKAGWIF